MTVLAKFKNNDQEMIVARAYDTDYGISNLSTYGKSLALFAKNDKIVVKSWFKALAIFFVIAAVLMFYVVGTIISIDKLFVKDIPFYNVDGFINLFLTFVVPVTVVFILVVILCSFTDYFENSLLSILKIPFNYFRILISKNHLYSYVAHCYVDKNGKKHPTFLKDQSWMLLDMEEVSRKYSFHIPKTIDDIEKYVKDLTYDERCEFFIDGVRASEINKRIYRLEQTLNNNGYCMDILKKDVEKEIAKLQKEQQKYEAKRKYHTVKLMNTEVIEILVNELLKNSQFIA